MSNSTSKLPKRVEEIFLHEISLQARHALRAVMQMDGALRQPGSVDEVFRYLEMFLNHAAKISLMLWPNDGDKKRGEHLRTCLGVKDCNPLKKRGARNDLQHFDERLDEWAGGIGDENYIDSNIGPLSAFGIGKARVLRHYDPSTKIFTFRSKHYDVQAICKAVMDIREAAARSQ